MTQLTVLPPPVREPELSRALQLQVDQLRPGGNFYRTDWRDDSGLRLAPVLPTYDADAEPAFLAYQRLCLPSNDLLVRTWLTKLMTAVQQTPSAAEIPARMSAIIWACEGIPAGCWSDTTLREAVRIFEWWPSAAQVHELLEPHAKRMFVTRDALGRIVAARHAAPQLPAPARPDPTEAEIAAVQTIVKSFVAERSFNQPDYGPLDRKVTPRHLSTGQLLMIYELQARNGVNCLEGRIAALRRQLEAPGVG